MIRILLILAVALATAHAAGHLPVTGEAVVLVVPDQVIVTVGIETRQPQLAASKEQNDAIAAKVNAAMTALGVKPEHVRADCLEIAPYYHHNDAKERLAPEHYRIVRTLVITLVDTRQVDTLLTGVVAAGATHVHDVEFRTTELRKHRDEARRMAIRAAREKASLLAGELGQRIGRATAINEGHIGWYGYSSYRSRDSRGHYQAQNASYNAGGGEGAGDTLVPPGQVAVRASVSVTFDLD